VIRYLDHYAPGWSCEVKDVIPTGTRCVVTVRISIPCLEGIISREATGTEDEELKGYGDPSSNAKAMALKRAAKFSLGLYLYQK
jgi:DNA repair RAD52-like protein 1, mitochondrial